MPLMWNGFKMNDKDIRLVEKLDDCNRKIRLLEARLKHLENFIFLDNSSLRVLYEKYKRSNNE